MGHPSDGQATAAREFKITGNVPPAFIEAMNKIRKDNRIEETEVTEINFLGDKKWIPHKHLKVGQRTHPDCVNWNNAGFHKKEIDWTTPKPMGMGEHPFADPQAIIPRAFRFMVETELDSKFQYYVENLEIDWLGKQIKMSLYETKEWSVDDILQAYLSQKCNRSLTVSLYDGCGNKIMVCRFSGVALHTYSTPLDYASSNVLSSKTVFSYKSVEKLTRPTK